MNAWQKGLIFTAAVMALTLIYAILFSRTPVPEGAVPLRDIVSYCIGDVTDDGVPELLAIAGDGKIDSGERHGQLLLICEASSLEDLDKLGYLPFEKIQHNIDLTGIMPVKVQIGDVNGDGINEIALCVYKTAKFHPVMAKRPFFFDLVEGNLIPLWLGSRLSRPFDDYILRDIDADGIDEIISVELLEDGKRVIAVYDWSGFGFEMFTQSEDFDGELRFDAGSGGHSEIGVIFSVDKEHSKLNFSLKDGNLVYSIVNL